MVAPMSSRGGEVSDGASPRRSRAGSWLTAAAVARVCSGEVLQRGGAATTVTTDSRADCTGKLFVALRGGIHDGHAFCRDAVQRGAAGLLVDRARDALPDLGRAASPFVVRVADTGRALLDLAAEHRRRHRARVVGITGSCGKTSTKEWLGAVLAAAMPTVRSPASFNNQVGVPLTLFAIDPRTRAAVVEIGTNAPGEIALLASVARPDIGIVTCVAPAHLEGLGSLDGVAREKAALPEALPPDGICILNGDDAACRAMASSTRARVEFTSVTRQTDWFATDVRFHALGTTFLLQGPRLGTHNVYNALAVIAAASHLGVAEEDVLRVLAAAPPAARRLESKLVRGITVFDDTYNMNPQSAAAALQAIAGLAGSGPGGEGRSIAVFGEMLELGERSRELHESLGAEVVRTRQDLLVCVGEGARAIGDGAVAAGMAGNRVHRAADIGEAFELLKAHLRPGDRVLCKASRRVGLDRLVDRLQAELGGEQAAAAEQG
jgi:UDP-N-acetylmuramoyl-tripeptide--D-alanyl-D-alanine ligase